MEYKKVESEIGNIVNDNVKKLAQLFPAVVKDGEVDFEALKEELGQFQEVNSEKYELTWAGKQNAKKIAQEDIVGRTLKYVPEESKNADTTENLYIEGDNLEVLKLLRQNYYGAVKMIYIDPPYNTGNDFVYKDSFAMESNDSDVAEGEISETGERYVINSKSQNRYHANWLNMIYSRIILAKDFLSEEGIIFISIDDNEIDNLIKICNEVFGESNQLAIFSWRRTDNQPNIGDIARVKEYVVCYCKNTQFVTLGRLPLTEKAKNEYRYEDEQGKFRRKILLDKTRGRHFYDVITKSGKVLKGPWMVKEEDFKEMDDKGQIYWTSGGEEQPYGKLYLEDSKGQIPNDFLGIEYGTNQRASQEIERLFGYRVFDFSKPVSLIKTFINVGTGMNDIVMDFFSGSAVTAQATIEMNIQDKGSRKFILVQISEKCNEKSIAYKNNYRNICEIGKERIRKVINDFENKLPNLKGDIGFKVFKLDNTNIKWNSSTTLGQLDMNQIETTPDLVDFMPGAKDIDIVYELMLRQRDVPLSAPMEQLNNIGKRTYLYASSYLVCLESEITEELVDKLAALNPLPIKFIFRDSAFKDDITLKDETMRRLKALVEKNSGESRKTYTVEFI